MSDPRTTLNLDVFETGVPAQVSIPVVNLLRSPGGPRDRQLLFGDAITILKRADGWSYVQATKDGYCGFVRSESHCAPSVATHYVCAPATHAYETASFKSPDLLSLSHASRLTVVGDVDGFAETDAGFVPLIHLASVSTLAADPAEVATLYLGTPYLWGGNSRWGIDCSGLVQAALLACGIPCPGDSGIQEALGSEVIDSYQRNDLLFWKGHVALVVDETTLVHANAGAMATVYEPIKAAIRRIAENGDGPVTARRRL